ncbi:MAG: methyltransferase family protein [Candidatus Heimdallarchaeota archaeon]
MDIAEGNNKELRRAGIKQLLLTCFMIIIHMTIFFISAGHIAMLRPWIYFGASFVHFSVSTAVIYKFNPELLVQRLKRKREGSRLWDEILMRTCNLMVLLIVPVVAGLDIGRFHWSSLDIHFVIVGFILLIVSAVLIDWAMVVNPHFEPTVRIQKDRGHKVITSGPYKIIRHPGYLAGILFALSIPLIIGSLVTFIPSGIYTLLMMIRTWLEDRTLNKELDGYSEYVKRVRYRLFPGIW